jgi:hypothetical protein
MVRRLSFRLTPAFLPLFIAIGCVPQPKATGNGGVTSHLSEESAQPAMATYNCADGGMMTIQNLGTSLRLVGPDGLGEELPAAPADQRSRYGQAHDAIVIDGREALVMKGGQSPLTCTR